MTVLEGTGQNATVGQPVAVKPAVRITNQTSQPASGVAVAFAAATGGGSVTGASATTDANGVARVGDWTLGTTAGAQTLTATANTQGSPATFTATAAPGPAAAVQKQGGDAQTAVAGSPVGVRPAVKVVDQFGNAVGQVGVTFAVGQGGGTVTGGAQTTGADGIATVGGWTLGQIAGPNGLTATVAGSGLTGNPATFAATGVAGAPASVVKRAGENQTAGVGKAVAIAPQVEVADLFGNKVPGATVTFAVASGGGSVVGATPTTSPAGLAAVGGWTLGAAPGANTLTATAGTVSATFTATALALLNPTQYVGTYTGTWTNTTFASTGNATATITVNEATKVATAAITVTGPVLGSTGVAPSDQQSSYGDTGANFNGVLPVMGTVTATIDAAGQIVAAGTNVPNPGIVRWDAEGTVTATQLRLTFKVTFTAGAPAVGTIALNKP